MADILSVLGMSYSDETIRDSIKYKLQGSNEPIGDWGHEYVRHLSAETIYEFMQYQEEDKDTKPLTTLALEIAPFFLKHNAEADACDLLLELEMLSLLPSLVDKDNYQRVCLYIIGYYLFNLDVFLM
jgi:26S proteasome regulatory subunit N1